MQIITAFDNKAIIKAKKERLLKALADMQHIKDMEKEGPIVVFQEKDKQTTFLQGNGTS